jgi:hypothetical protein
MKKNGRKRNAGEKTEEDKGMTGKKERKKPYCSNKKNS